MENTMKRVVEASYLTAQSAGQYRTILRYFYHQHERMRDFITPEEILQHLRTIPQFEQYEEEQLHQQLAQLVEWNNLSARQDMTNARTIEEYKKKRFRYQPTPYTIEIERLLEALQRLEKQPQTPDACMTLWEDILQYFKTIRTSTAAYSRYKEADAMAPYIISLDEAFAGVDEQNIRDMFEVVEQLGFNYIMNSQAIWGDYETVSALAISELVRPKNADFVTVVNYTWNGKERIEND